MKRRMVQSADGQHLADATSGEIMDGSVLVHERVSARSPFVKGLAVVSLDGYDELAQRAHEFGFQGLRVMLALIGRMNYENHVLIDHKKLGESLNMPRQNVGAAVRKLVDGKVLLLGPTISNQRTYRLNPEYIWRGKSSAHHAALKKLKSMTTFAVQQVAQIPLEVTAAEARFPEVSHAVSD